MVPFVGALWVLMARFGLAGAALAWTLRATVDCLILMRLADYRSRHLVRALPAVLLVAVCGLAARSAAWPPSGSVVAAAIAGVAAVALGFAADPVLRGALIGLIPLRARRRATADQAGGESTP